MRIEYNSSLQRLSTVIIRSYQKSLMTHDTIPASGLTLPMTMAPFSSSLVTCVTRDASHVTARLGRHVFVLIILHFGWLHNVRFIGNPSSVPSRLATNGSSSQNADDDNCHSFAVCCDVSRHLADRFRDFVAPAYIFTRDNVRNATRPAGRPAAPIVDRSIVYRNDAMFVGASPIDRLHCAASHEARVDRRDDQ